MRQPEGQGAGGLSLLRWRCLWRPNDTGCQHTDDIGLTVLVFDWRGAKQEL